MEALRAQQDGLAGGEVTQPQSTLGNLLCVGPRPLTTAGGDESTLPAMWEVMGTGLGTACRAIRKGTQSSHSARPPLRPPSLGEAGPACQVCAARQLLFSKVLPGGREQQMPETSIRKDSNPITPPSWDTCSQPLLLNGRRMPGATK